MQRKRLTWQEILSLCRKKIWVLLLVSLIFGCLGLFLSKVLITPQYTANTQILVYEKSTTNQQLSSSPQANLQLINTYKDFILSRTVLKDVSKKIENSNGNKVTVGHLQKQVSVTSKQNSQIFTISVTDSNPKKAALIANTVTSVFMKKVRTVMGLNNVTKVTSAVVPDKPVYPNLKINFAASFVFGLIIGFILILTRASSQAQKSSVN